MCARVPSCKSDLFEHYRPAPAASGQGPLPDKRVGFREMLLGRGLATA
jgi:hypothetical protein